MNTPTTTTKVKRPRIIKGQIVASSSFTVERTIRALRRVDEKLFVVYNELTYRKIKTVVA